MIACSLRDFWSVWIVCGEESSASLETHVQKTLNLWFQIMLHFMHLPTAVFMSYPLCAVCKMSVTFKVCTGAWNPWKCLNFKRSVFNVWKVLEFWIKCLKLHWFYNDLLYYWITLVHFLDKMKTAPRVTVVWWSASLYWRVPSDGTEREIKKRREVAASVSVALKTTNTNYG